MLSLLSVTSNLEHLPQQQPNQIEIHGSQTFAHRNQPTSLQKYLPPTKAAAVQGTPTTPSYQQVTGSPG